MKITLWIVALLLGFTTPLFSAEDRSLSDTKSAGVEAKAIPADEKKVAEHRKLMAEKLKEINGSKWEVGLKPADPKDKETTDVLTFQNNQIDSKEFSSRGYGPTNYTITMPEGSQTATWETMKTSSDGTVFMRGEWNKDMMSGSIVEQLDKGKKTREYYFSSKAKKEVAKTTAPIEEHEADAAPSKETKEESKALTSKESAKFTTDDKSVKS
jgi:hypothetical protein